MDRGLFTNDVMRQGGSGRVGQKVTFHDEGGCGRGVRQTVILHEKGGLGVDKEWQFYFFIASRAIQSLKGHTSFVF